ncbi:hypothetical protein RJT34_28222 [Clitoria ternatea]|uniref:Uncharacterized protein n=1 Tax=Clitoria ternatea TaxID=43366 RepID=A0AAN9FAP7_CLITE
MTNIYYGTDPLAGPEAISHSTHPLPSQLNRSNPNPGAKRGNGQRQQRQRAIVLPHRRRRRRRRLTELKTMAEEDPKALNFIPEVILKKRKSNEAFALRKKALFQQRNFNSRKTREFIKKPEDFIFEYRNREVDLIRLKRRVKRKLPELLNPKSKPLIVIRIQGKKEMHEKTRKALYSLGLRRRFSAVFVKPTVEVLAKLQRVEPYVTYGYPNLKSIKELIYKKGNVRIDKRKVPLTDNNIVEQELGKFGIVCIEDIVHHIDNAGPLFEEVVRFLWPFELNKPAEGLKGSKALFKEGGDTGDREDLINDLINKMN